MHKSPTPRTARDIHGAPTGKCLPRGLAELDTSCYRCPMRMVVRMATVWTCGALLCPLQAGETGEPAALVAALGAATWEEREAAQDALLATEATAVEAALAACLDAVRTHEDPEVRFRAWRVLEDLVGRHVFRSERGFLGVSLQQSVDTFEVDGHVVQPVDIARVLPGHAAMEHGIRPGWRIAAVDGQYCNITTFDMRRMIAYIAARPPGSPLRILLLTDTGPLTRVVPLGVRPEQPGDLPIEEQRRQFFRDWIVPRLESAAP